MKTIQLGALLLFSLCTFTFASAQNAVKKETLKIWGNCGMCKKVIEKSARTAGATTASWNEDSKELKVSYNESKTNSTKIQQAIAKSGYDTQDFYADDAAYNKLPGCCHYDRKAKDTDAAPVAKKCCDHEGCGTVKDACKGMECCKDKTGCKMDGVAMMKCKDSKANGKKAGCCKS